MDRTADDPGRVMTANPLSDSARTIAADRTVTARDIAAILLARWLVIASVLGLSLVLAIGYLVVTPRLYTGVASLLIDARTRPAVGDGGQSVNSYPDAILVESQVRVISSDLVLRRVVEAEHLDQDPEFAPPVGIGLRTRILTAIGLGNQAAPAADDPESRAVGTLAARVVVKRSERTYVADIEVTSPRPAQGGAPRQRGRQGLSGRSAGSARRGRGPRQCLGAWPDQRDAIRPPRGGAARRSLQA